MKRQRRRIQFAAFVALFGAPLAASANAGVPMLVLAWPAYVLALLPIVAIESHIGAQCLGLTWRELLPAVTIANIWSTFVGLPLGWAAMLVVEMIVGIGSSGLSVPDSFQKWLFPFYAAWVPAESPWQVYAAFVVLAVPFCLISIWIEQRVLLRKFPEQPAMTIRRWVKRANVWTYGLMVFVTLAFPLLG